MALRLLAAGARSTALPSVASRSLSVSQRLFRGGGRRTQSRPAEAPAPQERPSVGARVASMSRSAVSGTVGTAATVGTFIAADTLLNDEERELDAEIMEEDTRPSNTPTVYETPRESIQPVAPVPRLEELTMEQSKQGDAQLERELIAYASEMVMQKVDASPLLDQVSFLTNRYRLSRDEAFEIASGAQVYRFHPEVINLVAAVSSFNTRGTLLLGAQRADRGV